MNDKFLKLASKTLNEIFEKFNDYNSDLEIDFVEKNITIETVKEKVFVISIHEPTNQIWLSSPISGAHHFSYDDSNKKNWVSTRDKSIEIFSILKKEIDSEIR